MQVFLFRLPNFIKRFSYSKTICHF